MSPALAGLLGELSDLKRVRVAGRDGSLAEQGFARAWGALAAGAEPRAVALHETAAALAAVTLGGIDAPLLRAAGVADADDVARDAVVAAARDRVDPGLLAALRDAVVAAPDAGPAPAFVARLAAQPRAGATAPGQPRIVLEPPESHADHCFAVAVGAVLLAPAHGADPATCFVGALAHHLHNASVPDAGFAGEALLGDRWDRVLDHFTEAALAELTDDAVRERVRGALGLNLHLDSPEAHAVVAADVLDRVLQMRQYARAAAFTLDVALDELDLVHAGPLQAYGLAVVEAAGLR